MKKRTNNHNAKKLATPFPVANFKCSGCGKYHSLSKGRFGKFEYEGNFGEAVFWCKDCSDYESFRVR